MEVHADGRSPVLETRGLRVELDGFPALDGVELSVDPGELRVLIGANGAGKSTLIDVISGKTKPTAGTVLFKGSDIVGRTEPEIARMGIGRKFQTPTVFLDLTVQQNFEVAEHESFSVWSNLSRRMKGESSDAIDQVLERIGLLGAAHRLAAELAHGQRQWLEIGMLLMQNPALLLLDEPTAGMTASETTKTADILERLEGDHTIIVVEHDMAFVRRISRTITVLHQGKVLAEGNADEVQRDPLVIEAYLGTAVVGDA